MREPARQGTRVRSDAMDTHRFHRELETPKRRRRRPSCPIDPPRRRFLTRRLAETSGDVVTGSTPRFLGVCRPTRLGKRTRYFVKEKISRGFVSEKSSVTRDGLFGVQNHHIKFGASDKAYREKRTQSKSLDRKAQPQLAPKFEFHPKSDDARLLEDFKAPFRCGRCFLDTTQPESD